MHAVIAQGFGYHGVAFFTVVGLSWSEIRLRISKYPKKDVSDRTKRIFLEFEDTMVQIRPWKGSHQSEPVVLVNDGHAKIDLEALKFVKKMLETPYVPD